MTTTDSKANLEKKIVLEQLFASNPKMKLSVGTPTGIQTYTRKQIIEHVEQMDEVGVEYIKTQMDYLRSHKTGEIYSLLDEIESQED